ncbi:MAG: penicillin-binding protein activator LpoB [Elusimicrobiota bacterium]|nr:penicillin-binding protein activator LpoB [Elusimicrobiota bacterium]
MRKLRWAGVIALAVIAAAGCGGKTVKRVDVEKQIDLSGKWNDTDSRMVSEEMIDDCLSRPWLENHTGDTGEAPTVIVGEVVNKTDEHIISETFTKDLERAFINSGDVNVVASKMEREEVRAEREDMQSHASDKSVKVFMEEEAADYMLKGTINAINDKEGKKSVRFYQVNLELVDTETNQKVWIGSKKLKKYIKE